MNDVLSPNAVLARYREEDLPEFAEIELNSIEQVGNFGNRPLHVACVRGVMAEVTALLSAGADVNARGEMGSTPLHEAAGQGHLEVVETLLRHGADVSVKNELDNTPLEVATAHGFAEVAQALLQRSEPTKH